MKIKINKKLGKNLVTTSSVLTLVLLIFLLSTKSASANWGLDILGTIVSTIVSGLGWVLSKLMGILVYIAQYNDFIRSGAVSNGWVIARDISNMFFVIILLVIAFATILRIENYSYKKWLPKLILMAVLINFSKTICGLMIDVAQVIMLTFVNAFKDVGAGNLTNMLGIENWQSLQGVEKISKWEVVAAFFLALIYVIISLITVAAMIGMLVMRIIMLWVYVVLSPFAYLLSAFPGGEKYARQWWSEFTKNLIVGPVLAFFIWLSFASLSSMSSTAGSTGLGSNLQDNNAGNTTGGGGDINEAQAGQFGTSDTMVKFIVSIAMLIGGMKIAGEIGGEAGSIAGKGLTKVKTLGAAGAGAVGGFALARAKWAGGKAKDAGMAVGGVAAAGIGTGLGYADRMLGAGANKIIGKKNAAKLGLDGKGFISTTAGMIATAPGKMASRIKGGVAGSPESQELDKARRKYFDESRNDPNALMEFKGKKYKKGTGINSKSFVETDDAGNVVENVDQYGGVTNNVLRDSGGKRVDMMNASSAAWHDSTNRNFKPVTAAADSKQAEAVETAQKKLDTQDLNTDEMMRMMKSAGTSVVEKMALAMKLASKGAFKTKADVNEAKKYIGNNNVMSDKFDDEIDKKRPDLNYNFDNELDVASFKKRLDSGKIDSTKLGDGAYKNGKMLSAMQDYHGDDFGRVMQSVANRGKKYKEGASTGLKDMRSNMAPQEDAERLLRMQNDDDAADVVRKKLRSTSGTRAKLVGDWQGSFTNASGSVDQEGLGKFVANAKAANLNNMSVDDYQKMSDTSKSTVINNINLSQLVSMKKNGENNELVGEIVKEISALYPQGVPVNDAKHAAILSHIELRNL